MGFVFLLLLLSFLFFSTFIFIGNIVGKENLLHNLDHSGQRSISGLLTSLSNEIIEYLLACLLSGCSGFLLSLRLLGLLGLLLVCLILLISLDAELSVVLFEVRVSVLSLEVILIILDLFLIGQVQVPAVINELALISAVLHLNVFILSGYGSVLAQQVLLQLRVLLLHHSIELFLGVDLALFLLLLLLSLLEVVELACLLNGFAAGAPLHVLVVLVCVLLLSALVAALLPDLEVTLALRVLNRSLRLVCHSFIDV